MTPAEELRAAAAELRRIAASDLDWPWVRAEFHVSPALASPLAEWLEEAARQVVLNARRAPRHRRDITHALAVARVILGTTR